ncbi:MAG: cytochrome b/b6 domain-containing protein [Hyphomicrobiales bacterium]|nr:cytochrome b/b6 domain-containing protein [Hyphomicrobiales bacterium]
MSAGARWSRAQRWSHQLSGAAILAALVGAIVMNRLVSDQGLRFMLYQVHKTLGIVALVLVLWRIGVRMRMPLPTPIRPAWQNSLSVATHRLLYVLIFIIPLTGWAMISASPLKIPTRIFGLVPLPDILPTSLPLYLALLKAHAWLGWALGAVLVLHITGALAHVRDGTFASIWRAPRPPV